MNQKMQFVSLAATGRFSVSQLCEDFAISRKTGPWCQNIQTSDRWAC